MISFFGRFVKGEIRENPGSRADLDAAGVPQVRKLMKKRREPADINHGPVFIGKDESS